MKLIRVIKNFTLFERLLWAVSVIAIIFSAAVFGGVDYMSVAASVIGVTALIFVAKGHLLGQVLTIIFAVLYGIISVQCRYYGEAITYICMTAPAAVVTLIEWIKHPYKRGDEVEVARLTRMQIINMVWLTAVVTFIFYFVLKALGNANLIFSTISVTTSFLASYLTACRNEYYAVAYAANDIVLIVLWAAASITNISYVPMVACFIMFLFNDLYGFYNWLRMKTRQKSKIANEYSREKRRKNEQNRA